MKGMIKDGRIEALQKTQRTRDGVFKKIQFLRTQVNTFPISPHISPHLPKKIQFLRTQVNI